MWLPPIARANGTIASPVAEYRRLSRSDCSFWHTELCPTTNGKKLQPWAYHVTKQVASRVIYMAHGEIVQENTPEQFFSNPCITAPRYF